jgi:hypothetical protein
VKTNITAELCTLCAKENSACWKCSLRCTVCFPQNLPADATDADGKLCSTCSSCEIYRTCASIFGASSPGPSDEDNMLLELSTGKRRVGLAAMMLLVMIGAAAVLL